MEKSQLIPDTLSYLPLLNTLRPETNSRHVAEGIFKCTFFEETFRMFNMFHMVLISS